jgi:hypothetical protein
MTIHQIDAVNFVQDADKSDWGTFVPRIKVENGIKLGYLLE